MKHFNEHIQEKLNSFEYPYESGAWESFRHKMLIKKIIRWASAAFIAATVVTTVVLLLPYKENKSMVSKEIKNNIDNKALENKRAIVEEPKHQTSQNVSVVNNMSENKVSENNTNKQVKNTTEAENNLVSANLQNNGASINDFATINFTKDNTQGCAPMQVKFNANNSLKFTSCVWDFGDGTTSFETNPIHIYKKGGKYKVILTAKTAEGKNIVSEPQLIQVYNKPKAIFEYSINDNCIRLQNNSKQSIFQNWYINDSIVTDELATVCIKKTGLYNISIVVENNDGCIDSTNQKIELIYNMPVKFADAFTPDGDGINDVFGPIVADYSQYEFKMFVYKKEGKCIYEHFGSPVNWDGIDQNTKQICPADIYFYRVIAVDKLGNKNEFSGKINLKR